MHLRFLAPLPLLLAAAIVTAQGPATIPLTISRAAGVHVSGAQRNTANLSLTLPGKATVPLAAQRNQWFGIDQLNVDLWLPADAPTDALLIAHVIDRDGLWFQRHDTTPLIPGQTNRVTVPYSPETERWVPRGHHGDWHARTMLSPRTVALDLYSETAYTGACAIAISDAVMRSDTKPPTISAVRPSARTLGTYSRYEVRMALPDRYPDPFDIDQIHLSATFTHSNTPPVTIDGFYYQSFFRTAEHTGEEITPQGRPEWRVRFCPPLPGDYQCELKVRDSFGETTHTPLHFAVTNSSSRGIARVSKRDTRFFETSDDRFFFPIGHNIRSPFDTRMDRQFPWRYRREEGSLAYERYFTDMHAHGEDFAEIWSCAWSLGLEWSPRDHGYHGVGDYNMIHAWELDHVLDLAQQHQIFINLVLNNHGRLSTFCDEEWDDNPYNRKIGGYLSDPMDFFDNPRAIRDTEKLYRYMVARYAAYANIFAWELWSELNLIGPGRQNPKPHYDKRVVNWHDHFGRFIRSIDPAKHLIATHFSSDYKMQNPAIVSLPSMDHAPVDAYHNSNDPLQIVQLINRTTAFNARFKKPVIVTEFGGSHLAGSENFLAGELHCALWASACSGLASAPLFWWWQLIEEAGYYPEYAALRKFMDGVDLRDPALVKAHPAIRTGVHPAPYPLGITAMVSPEQAIGWVHASDNFLGIDPATAAEAKDIHITITGLTDAIYRVTFTDTTTGLPLQRVDQRSRNGQLDLALPPFRRDIAFKLATITP